jgi:hypothetical protein
LRSSPRRSHPRFDASHAPSRRFRRGARPACRLGLVPLRVRHAMDVRAREPLHRTCRAAGPNEMQRVGLPQVADECPVECLRRANIRKQRLQVELDVRRSAAVEGRRRGGHGASRQIGPRGHGRPVGRGRPADWDGMVCFSRHGSGDRGQVPRWGAALPRAVLSESRLLDTPPERPQLFEPECSVGGGHWRTVMEDPDQYAREPDPSARLRARPGW